MDLETSRVQPAVLTSSPNQESDYGAHRWAADGYFLYEQAGRGIISRNPATGHETVIVSYADFGVKRLNGPTAFQSSPDQRSLAFSGRFSEGDSLITVLKVQSLGGAPTELARATSPQAIVFEGWTPDSKEVLFARKSSKQSDPSTLWRIPVTGGEPRSLGLSIPGLRVRVGTRLVVVAHAQPQRT